jgi:hypothetical protein
VRFTLVGVPEGAAVSVDGRQLEGTSFEVPRARGAATLAVEAAGHRPWSTRLDLARADAASPNTVRVDLQRAGPPAARRRAVEPRAAPAQPRPRAGGVQPIVGGFGEIP